jgi:hypothetical protein
MLDNIIKKTALDFSFSQNELINIAITLNNLKDIINNDPDFKEPFLGGSYKRRTMVKNVSDVDVYFKYTGIGNASTALVRLKNCLIKSYPNTIIKQDTPSILADFNKIPINITPFKEDSFGNKSIPDKGTLLWQPINFGVLESYIIALRDKSNDLIDLIKILKLWNRNNNKKFKNYIIEKNVCDYFLYPTLNSNSISDWIYTYFSNSGLQQEANNFFPLMKNNNEESLKIEWNRFMKI